MTSKKNIYLLLIIILFIAFAGCNNTSKKVKPHKKEPFICNGVISLTSTEFISPDNPPFKHSEFSAMFPKYKIRDIENVKTLLPAHVPDLNLELNTCSMPIPTLASMRKKELTRPNIVSLEDAGNMFISSKKNMALVPTRTFPDLLKIINGVIYYTDEFSNLDLVPDETYTIKTTGSDVIQKFEVLLNAPKELGDITINETSPDETTPVITLGKPIDVKWDGAGYGDEVIISIKLNGPGISWNIQCRIKDDGTFSIPPEITNQLTIDSSISSTEMSIERVRQISFASKGLSQGDFSFVVKTNFLIEFDENS
ncbi:MAG: hypothetical protein JXR91_08250 [Deltaproteobacteria bacterium]|nr:hypothetical protein [Deltaproteobacteria bacterium]